VFGPTRDPLTAHYFADGCLHPPQGVRGGLPGLASGAAKLTAEGTRTELPPIGGVELEPGEWLVGVECGGGGYGEPCERDPERVRTDVLEGWVTREQAEAVYGVVFTGSAEDDTLEVDEAATAARRSAERGSASGR
jgi:N-methylhydantoinase B